MMNFLFWTTWPKAFRSIVSLGVFVLMTAVIGVLFFYFRGEDNVLHWDTLTTLHETPFVLENLEAGEANFGVPATAYSLTEQFVASELSVQNPFTDAFLLVLAILGITVLLTATTTLPRIWFLGVMALLLLGIGSAAPDVLLNRSDKTLAIVLCMLFGGVSYYFHAFRSHTNLWTRWLVFAVISGVSILVISKLNTQITAHDFLIQGYFGGVALAVIFCFWVCYETMLGLLWLATNQSGKNNLLHFVFLSLFYLGNVALVYFHQQNDIDWNILYLSPLLILGVSTIVGWWGLTLREQQNAETFRLAPTGAMLYLGAGAVCFAVIGFGLASQNGPVVDVISKAITLSHLTGGSFFFLFIILNFGGLLASGKSVIRVVFKPPHIALWHVRGLAAVLCVVLLYSKNFSPAYQALAGYYNTLGDRATAQKDYRLAETYYQEARVHDFSDHHANYGLASLAWQQGDFASAAGFFRVAIQKTPSRFAYAGLARSLANEDMFFDALFAAREGSKVFPNSGELLTNLALLHGQAGGLDSARYFYEKAAAFLPESPTNNRLSLDIQAGKIADAQSFTEKLSPKIAITNQLAVQLLAGKEKEMEDVPNPSSPLNITTFAGLNNRVLAGIKTKKYSFRPLQIEAYEELNPDFTEDLRYLRAITEYHSGNKLNAFTLLETAQSDSARVRWGKALMAFLNVETQDVGFASPINLEEAQKLIQQSPLHPKALEASLAILNKNDGKQTGYDHLLAAMRFRPDSPEIIQLYILQSLEMGLRSYADEKLLKLQNEYPESYGAFFPVYQQKIALIEKQRAAFQ